MLKTLALISALFLQAAYASPTKAPKATTLNVDSVATFHQVEAGVEFHAVGSPGFLKIDGKGGKAVGTVTVNGGVATGHFQLALDDFKTGIGLRDRHMREKYLETSKWKDAFFDLDAWKVTSTSSQFSGKLTLKGKVEPVFGTAVLTKDGILRAEFEIDLADFPIGVPSHLGVTLAETVTVTVNYRMPTTVIPVGGK